MGMSREEVQSRVAAVHQAYEDLHARLSAVEKRQQAAIEARGGKVAVADASLGEKPVLRQTLPEFKPDKAKLTVKDYHASITTCPERMERSRVSNLICDSGTMSSVQFLSTKEYSVEGGVVNIEVIRVGATKGTSSISYHTEDRAAKAGVKYFGVSGTLVFKEGESGMKIPVSLCQDNSYVPVSSFLMLLHDPVNCELDPTKDTCRVTIMDDDTFPTNSVKDFIKADQIAMIPSLKIIKSFWDFALGLEGVGYSAKICLVGDQVGNLCKLFMNYLNAYLVNQVIATANLDAWLITGERLTTLYLLAVLSLAPFGVMYLWDRYKASLGVGHRIQGFLQAAVVRTYFNLENDVQRDLRPNHVIDVLETECAGAVSKTYASITTLKQLMGSMAMQFTFVAFRQPHVLWMVVAIFATFAVLLVYELPPAPGKVDAVHSKKSSAESFREIVDTCSHHFELIRDFDAVTHNTDLFDKLLHTTFIDDIKAGRGGIVKKYLPEVVCLLLATAYLIAGGRDVLEGTVPVGTYVVTLTVIKSMGALVNQSHGCVLVLLKSTKSLLMLTDFLSLEVDVPQRIKALTLSKEEHWRNRDLVKQKQIDAPASSPMKKIPPADLMSVQFKNVSINYGDNKVLTGVNLELKQGTLTAIVGAHSAGKGTLIRVLASRCVPCSGSMFVPAHLRMVHCARFPELVEGMNLTENLMYGTECTLDRVFKIMAELIDPAESEVMNILEKERAGTPLQFWERKMTYTDYYMISLARALLYNVEFMVMERVMDLLNTKKAENVMRILREHIDNRGLYEEGSRNSRRPRTVIFCSLDKLALLDTDEGKYVNKHVDSVWALDMDGKITAHDLTDLDY